jgi:hypothetical protein
LLRRRFLSSTLPVAAACLVGCKRQRDANAPGVWDDAPVPGRAEAIAKLAPPWPLPARAVIANELLTFWLAEKDSPAMHVRLMFPTAKPAALSAVAVASIGEHLRFELERRLRALSIDVDVQHRPGRLEIGLHGRNESIAQALRTTGLVLGRGDASTALLAARQRLVGRMPPPSSEEVAAALLASRLLGTPAASQHIDPRRIEPVDRDALTDAWTTMTDPRRTVMVVHAGTEAAAGADALGELASQWQGKGRAQQLDSSIARLRPKLQPAAGTQHLLTEGSAPFLASGGSLGGASLVLGRTIPTGDAASRAMARLGQRVIQEELDARVTISGPHALFVVHIALPDGDPDRRARAVVDDLAKLATTRHPQQRLFAAAQLWLGARVVQSSLDGEDWTALWSESIDLAENDADIPRALAMDATAMLDVGAEAMQAWQKQWLDPRRGAPGWQWVVAGADAEVLRRLSKLAPVEQLTA